MFILNGRRFFIRFDRFLVVSKVCLSKMPVHLLQLSWDHDIGISHRITIEVELDAPSAQLLGESGVVGVSSDANFLKSRFLGALHVSLQLVKFMRH